MALPTLVSNDLCLDDDKFVKAFAAFVSNHVLHVFSSLLLHTSSCTHLFDFLFLRKCSRANFGPFAVVPWLRPAWDTLSTISIGVFSDCWDSSVCILYFCVSELTKEDFFPTGQMNRAQQGGHISNRAPTGQTGCQQGKPLFCL